MPLKQEAGKLLEQLDQPVDVAIGFLELFRFIEDSPDGRFGWWSLGPEAVNGREYAREVHLWRNAIRKSIGQNQPFASCLNIAGLGAALQRIAYDGRITPEDSKRLVIALRVLDEAFRGVHPGEFLPADDSTGFIGLRTRIREGRPLFKAGHLHVYPKPRRLNPFDLRGQGRLTDLLTNLAVISCEPQLRVVHKLAFAEGFPGPAGFRRIGIIPTIRSHDELIWKKEGDWRYSIEECPGARPSIHSRVTAGLALLAEEGADLVLMPELVASPALTNLVADELSARTRRGEPNPSLVLAGTQIVKDADDKVRNRACVLDGEGDLLWEQDKLHAYTFTVREQADAGYPLGEIDLADRTEAIDIEPRTLVFVDLSPTQRLAVLTCEDFIQPDPHRTVVADLVATTILVPIMSGPRKGQDVGWIQDAALNYVRRPGATCVVANSGTLLGPTPEGWQFGHVVASCRVRGDWKPLPDASSPVAWLADLGQKV